MSTIIVVDNDLDTLLTALYVFLDDHVIGPRRVGRPPWLTDAELLCLAIAQVLLGFPGERHWIRYARKHQCHRRDVADRDGGAAPPFEAGQVAAVSAYRLRA